MVVFVNLMVMQKRLDCSLMVYHYPIASARQIARAQAVGLEVSTYTVNDLNQIKRLAGWGIDSVITDHPVKFLHLQS